MLPFAEFERLSLPRSNITVTLSLSLQTANASAASSAYLQLTTPNVHADAGRHWVSRCEKAALSARKVRKIKGVKLYAVIRSCVQVVEEISLRRLVKQKLLGAALLEGVYKGRILELSPRNLVRYAAISEATFPKSLTFLPRISWIICRRPTTKESFCSAERPSGTAPIWTRIRSSAGLEACVSSRLTGIQHERRKLNYVLWMQEKMRGKTW